MNPIDNETDGTHILRFIFRNWKIYLIVIVTSVAVGIGVSMQIPKKYTSFAILYPAQNHSIESVVDNPIFGYDVEADRLLQVLYSEEVLDSCAKEFGLYRLFEIDTTNSEARDVLKEVFYKDITFSRSQYVSIVISANTIDPQLSADIVNYIVNLVDGIRNRIFKKNLLIVYQSLEKEYTERQNYLEILVDSVANLRKSTSVEVLTMMNNQVVLKNNSSSSAEEQTMLERTLNNYLFEQSQINNLSAQYMRAKTQFERPATQVFVLQYATPSFKRRTPDYFTNVMVSILCSVVFLTGFLLLSDKIKSVRLRD